VATSAPPAEPFPSDLLRLVQGHWLADLRFGTGPLQLTVSLAGNNEFVGSMSKQAQAMPWMAFSGALPELYPVRGFWSANGRELALNGQWTNVMNGVSQPSQFATYFSRIFPNELHGFTLPERLSCIRRRNC
jgi:hypothetical protein